MNTRINSAIEKGFYCLRKLRTFSVNPEILLSFYRSAISSVLVFGIVCWTGN